MKQTLPNGSVFMNALLNPAVFLMNRLTYPRKLVLVGLIFLVPLALLVFLFVSEINSRIVAAERELIGAQALRPVKLLISRVQEHRGVYQLALNGDDSAWKRLDELDNEADQVMVELDAFDRKYGPALKTSEDWKRIRRDREALRARRASLSAEENFRIHSAYIECLQDYQLRISNATGLNLDPELDANHLVDALVAHLTSHIEVLGKLRALSSVAAQRKGLAEIDRRRLEQLAAEAQKTGRKLFSHFDNLHKEIPGLKARLDEPLRESMGAAAFFLSDLQEKIMLPDVIRVDGRVLFASGTRAIDATYRLSDATLPVLNEVLNDRIEKLVFRKYALLAMAGGFLLLAIYFFLGFTRALIGQLATLRQGAKQVVEGDMDTQVRVDSRDEMSAIAYFFNAMVDALRYQMAKVTQNEAALRDSEEKYRALMEQANDALLLADISGKLLDANRRTEDLLGYSKEELLQLHALDLHPPEEKKRVEEGFREVVEHRTSRHEYLVRRKDGSTVVVDVAASLIEHGGGKAVLGIFRDISERKCIEEQLALAATVYESTVEGIMITDVEGTIVSVNRAFTDLTGYPKEEAVGQKPSILKSGRHSAEFYRSMWEALFSRGSWQGEVWDRRKDGGLFPAWLTLGAVRNEDQTLKHFVAIFSDISTMKESQQRIEHLANYDVLTELPNRNLFHDRLRHAIFRAARQRGRFALMFIDLDNFKIINDTLGHDAGDQLLQEAAVRLKECIREEDTIARLGGDEFTVLLESEENDAIARTAQRILDAFDAGFRLLDQEMNVTCSIGISIYPDDGADEQALMKNSDIAMYRAKQKGKNNFQLFRQAD